MMLDGKDFSFLLFSCSIRAAKRGGKKPSSSNVLVSNQQFRACVLSFLLSTTVLCSWGGVPLWPKKQKPDPGPCLHCGAQQVFEMQVLAPTLHFLEETCTWLMDDDDEADSHVEQIQSAMQVLSSWQWLTVAVFSCPNACQMQEQLAGNCKPGQCAWQEEVVMLALEEP